MSVTTVIRPMTSDMSTFDPIRFSSSENGSALWASIGKSVSGGLAGIALVLLIKQSLKEWSAALYFSLTFS